MVTENLVVSLVDEHRGGPLDGVGKRESAACDVLGGQGRRALLYARMCTGACFCWRRVYGQPLGPVVAAFCCMFDASLA